MAESLLTTYINELLGYVGDDGVILEDMETQVNTVIVKIEDLSGMEISVDLSNRIIVNGVTCTSKNMLKQALTSEAERSDLSQFFSGTNVEVGLLASTGGETLAKRLMAANGGTTSNKESFSFTYSADAENGVYTLSSSYFKIIIQEIREGQMANIALTTPSGEQELLIFSEYEDFPYIQYYIYKGGSGDFFIKGVRTADAVEPDPDTAEETFGDISMNQYGAGSGSVGNRPLVCNNNAEGGFAVIAMQNKQSDSSVTETDSVAALVMNTNAAPLFIFMNDEAEATERWAANLEMRQSIVPSSENRVHLAPIFAPSCGLYTSRYSYWAAVAPMDGVYDLTADSSYRYDHGFCLRKY